MKRDVLSELAAGTMTLQDAEALYDEIMDSDGAPGLPELLGLSRAEWTAFGHGVGFDELARWRASGWPAACPRCGKAIVPEDLGWMAKEQDHRSHRLVHIACLVGD